MFAIIESCKRFLGGQASAKKENMKLWQWVQVTNPDTTQAAEKEGRKFIAICAQAQRQRATEVFGPYGKGWGLKSKESKFSLLTKELILFQGEFFYSWQGRRYSFPVESSIAHSHPGKNGLKLDDECIKKVVTDAETKALSKLGFNADVFLGLFDDNRYVDDLRKEFAEYGTNATLENVKSIYQNKLSAVRARKEITAEQMKRFARQIASVRTPGELAEIRLELNRLIKENATRGKNGANAMHGQSV
ncbi:hypothetical protein KC734_04425 [candidate division KSB1 bacterium]|nr:hypothetical protein [candidate division KSB1 bacterium]